MAPETKYKIIQLSWISAAAIAGFLISSTWGVSGYLENSKENARSQSDSTRQLINLRFNQLQLSIWEQNARFNQDSIIGDNKFTRLNDKVDQEIQNQAKNAENLKSNTEDIRNILSILRASGTYKAFDK